MLAEPFIRTNRALQNHPRLCHRRCDDLVVVGLFCETLVEEIAARAPRLKRRLHRRRGDSKTEKALRGLINFQFPRHASPMSCGGAWFRAGLRRKGTSWPLLHQP